MLIDPKIIENRLTVLIGVKATRIHRGSNMLVFGFGPFVKIKNYKGEIISLPAYSIDVQCVWRILSSEGIVVGFRDFYHPAKKLTNEEYDNWNWDVFGNNMFDVITCELRQLFQEKKIVVERICADKYAGFSLFLSNGFELQVIPDHSKPREFWSFADHTENGGYYEFFEESDWQ